MMITVDFKAVSNGPLCDMWAVPFQHEKRYWLQAKGFVLLVACQFNACPISFHRLQESNIEKRPSHLSVPLLSMSI